MNGLTFNLLDPINGRQSSIKEFMDCHRLYGWSRVEDLTPDRPSFPLEFGSATHVFQQERGRGVPLPEAMAMGIKRLMRDFPPVMFPGEEEQMLEHRELAARMWPLYEQYWQDDLDIPLGQEVKGRVEVGTGTNVFLVFQLDKLVARHGALWVKDYKTMAKNDDRTWRQFELDIQPTAYVYGATKVLGTRVAGVIIDGLIKTKMPQFRREEYLRTDEQLEEFEAEFVEVMKDIAVRHARVAAGENWKTVFYKNTRHCNRFYQCPMFALCQRDTPMARMAYKRREADYMDDPSILDRPKEKVQE